MKQSSITLFFRGSKAPVQKFPMNTEAISKPVVHIADADNSKIVVPPPDKELKLQSEKEIKDSIVGLPDQRTDPDILCTNSIIDINQPASAESILQSEKELKDSIVGLPDHRTDIDIPCTDSIIDINQPATCTSSYEQIRLENIQRNQAFLAQLGLHDLMGKSTSGQVEIVSKAAGAKRRKLEAPVVMPRRVQPKRGARAGGVDYSQEGVLGEGEEEEDEASEEEEEEGCVSYDMSSVSSYLQSVKPACYQQSLSASTDGLRTGPVSTPVLQPSPLASFQCDLLAAVYSLHYHPQTPSLLVSAGKGGYVTLYTLPASDDNLQPEDAEAAVRPPLLAFKAHDRWVSSCRFVPSLSIGKDAHSSVLLLTSSDDGTVKLWDVSQSRSGTPSGPHSFYSQPKQVTKSQCGHNKGIFAMDEMAGKILTGSKDKSVCVSLLTDSCQIVFDSEHILHEGVVKSVSWRHHLSAENDQMLPGGCPPVVFASGSQDASVCIKDTRSPPQLPEVSLQGVHMGGVHTVQWCPFNGGEHLLLTAGFDGSVQVFDIRAASNGESQKCSPVHVFRDRDSGKKKQRGSITTPSFLNSEAVVIPWEMSGSVSIHSILTGKTLSRGTISEVPMAVSCSVARGTTTGKTDMPMYVVAAMKRKGLLQSFDVQFITDDSQGS